jgi:hypothetical protein
LRAVTLSVLLRSPRERLQDEEHDRGHERRDHERREREAGDRRVLLRLALRLG